MSVWRHWSLILKSTYRENSEMEHTKEPWAIDPDDRPGMEWNNQIIPASNPNRAICFMSHDGTDENIECQANARRIVACVNACAGLPTADLERMSLDKAKVGRDVQYSNLMQQRDEYRDTIAQQAELLAAHKAEMQDWQRQLLSAQQERERCARVCETLRVTHGNGDPDGDECAAAIRALP